MTATTTEEYWKDIPGYEGLYEASHLGNIQSFDRTVTRGRSASTNIHGQLLSYSRTAGGQLKVRLSKEGKTTLVTVARVLLETFHRPAAKGEVAVHLDRDLENLHADNLCWMTRSDAYEHMKEGA